MRLQDSCSLLLAVFYHTWACGPRFAVLTALDLWSSICGSYRTGFAVLGLRFLPHSICGPRFAVLTALNLRFPSCGSYRTREIPLRCGTSTPTTFGSPLQAWMSALPQFFGSDRHHLFDRHRLSNYYGFLMPTFYSLTTDLIPTVYPR